MVYGIESNLEDLIKGLLIDSGGIVNGRYLGRKLAACSIFHNASKSALQDLKENFGSLKRFVTAHKDLFNTKMIKNGKSPSQTLQHLIDTRKCSLLWFRQ